MTMSSGDLDRIESRPRGISASEEARCDWTWESRCCAFDMLEVISSNKASAAQKEGCDIEGNRWSFGQCQKILTVECFRDKPRHGHN